MKVAVLTGLLEATTESLVELRLEREKLRAINTELMAALQECAESLAFVRDKIGICGEGDGKDRKADHPDDIGSGAALRTARAAITKATGATP